MMDFNKSLASLPWSSVYDERWISI
jgi:hypothetical protein